MSKPPRITVGGQVGPDDWAEKIVAECVVIPFIETHEEVP
jgi:hypothetical protein